MNETFLAQLGLLLVSVQITDADAGVIFVLFYSNCDFSFSSIFLATRADVLPLN